MERPLTLKSGVALQSNYSVQHRSDILMEDQIETVKKNQEAVKKALQDLENAKTEEEIDKCRQVVQEVREKSEQSVMVLQVLHKVNTELMFARSELDAALEKQRGDINEARKRVMWLEDRMGILCGKVRIRGQPARKDKNRSYRSPDRSTFRSRLGSDGESSDDSFDPRARAGKMGKNKSIDFRSDTTRHQAYSPSESGSEYQPPARTGMMDTPSSEAESYLAAQQDKRMRGPGLDDSDSESETATPAVPQTLVSKTHSVSDSGSESDDEAEPVKPTKAPETPASVSASRSEVSSPDIEKTDAPKIKVTGSDSEAESEDEAPSGVPKQHEVVQLPSELDDRSESRDDVNAKYEEETVTSRPDEKFIQALEADDRTLTYAKTEDELQMEDQTVDYEHGAAEREKSDMSERTDSGRSSVSATSGDSTLVGLQKKDKPGFMTEVSMAKSVTIKTPHKDGKRRVTFRDAQGKRRVRFRVPTFMSDDKDRTGIRQLTEYEEDWARDYWYSEHHRFEYSEYSEVLCDIDPLSYHSMGLAVPGTFIEKSDRNFSDLPWRARRKGSDVNDIHKIALDKLATRVHSMYGKVFDAAMLSVQPTQTDVGRKEISLFSSFDNNRELGVRSVTPTTDGRPGMVTAPPTTADATSRPVTVSTVVIPIKLKPGLNVYHPKPIPPPEMLPLTRMSKDKEYPRLANAFSLTDISEHKPAVRIVDQRNLHKETKLKLFKERPKREDEGPSTTEKKFRMMLERDKSSVSRSSRSSRQTTEETPALSLVSKPSRMGKGFAGTRLSTVRSLTKASTWSKMKPSSRGKEYGGLKWERVKTIVHVNLVSTRSEEREHAAKHLGILRCGDAMVFYALKERLRLDDDSRVRYEAAKSLVLLGCWDEEVIQVILKYLVMGNTEIRQDLIRTMIDGKNVQYVNKKTQSFPELVKVLSHFCRNPDPDDTNAFDAAVLLGKLCVADENAKFKLLRSLDQSTDTHIKAKALEVLTKQLSVNSWDVVKHLLELFQESPVWKYRALAADLLIVLGRQNVCKKHEEERVYQILERKLWDDPTRDVRIAAAKALTALGMFSKACERIEKRLEDTDEDIRAQAVISVGTLEMKNEKIIRLLLEMLELDSSEYVRLMIARTFTILKLTDKRVLRGLRERDKVDGPLARKQDLTSHANCLLSTPAKQKNAKPSFKNMKQSDMGLAFDGPKRESRKALKVLESLAPLPRLITPGGQRSITSRGTLQAASSKTTSEVIV